MSWLDHDDLTTLCEQRSGVHVSLFVPLEREPDKRQANQIHLKNLIRQGRQQLAEDDFLPSDLAMPKRVRDQLFQPAEDLLQDGRFFPESGPQGIKGLAIYLAQDMHQIHYLPLPLDEAVVIGPRFHISPLLPLVEGDGRFYLLQLSQNEVKLWHGAQFSLEPVDVPALPAGLEDALALEDPEQRELQFHTSTTPSSARGEERLAAFHGQDADKEKKGAILRFCREVNEAIQEQITDENVPMLLASVDYLQPIYQEANTYPHLLSEGISGNLEHLNESELHKRAWPIAEQHFAQRKEAAIAQYREFMNTENSSQQVKEILPAATYGRVDTLLVSAEGSRQRGRFAADSGELEMCGEEETYTCEDLLNIAAAQTLLYGGTSFVVPAEKMPDQAPMAAIFRYSVPAPGPSL